MLAPEIVKSLMETVAPCEAERALNDINELTHESVNFNVKTWALQEYNPELGTVLSNQYIAHPLTKDKDTLKYTDHISRQKFAIDPQNSTRAIDIEPFVAKSSYPSFYEDLVLKLDKYGKDHYPSSFARAVIPEGQSVHVIIIGQKVSDTNFYSGQWLSLYTIEGNVIRGKISLDIHYYEDGNVRLKFDEKDIKEDLAKVDASAIVNAINKIENDMTLRIASGVEKLNQETFKNLRRLLPVTRSKINWGKAIGNYRLGSDVVNAK